MLKKFDGVRIFYLRTMMFSLYRPRKIIFVCIPEEILRIKNIICKNVFELGIELLAAHCLRVRYTQYWLYFI